MSEIGTCPCNCKGRIVAAVFVDIVACPVKEEVEAKPLQSQSVLA